MNRFKGSNSFVQKRVALSYTSGQPGNLGEKHSPRYIFVLFLFFGVREVLC